jgi:hypothetical protein
MLLGPFDSELLPNFPRHNLSLCRPAANPRRLPPRSTLLGYYRHRKYAAALSGRAISNPRPKNNLKRRRAASAQIEANTTAHIHGTRVAVEEPSTASEAVIPDQLDSFRVSNFAQTPPSGVRLCCLNPNGSSPGSAGEAAKV